MLGAAHSHVTKSTCSLDPFSWSVPDAISPTYPSVCNPERGNRYSQGGFPTLWDFVSELCQQIWHLSLLSLLSAVAGTDLPCRKRHWPGPSEQTLEYLLVPQLAKAILSSLMSHCKISAPRRHLTEARWLWLKAQLKVPLIISFS